MITSKSKQITLALALLAAGMLVVQAGCDSAGENPPVEPPAFVPPITVPEGFRVEVFAGGLNLPTSLAFAPDGSNRLFFNELQTGKIRIVQDGVLLPEPFAQVQTHTTGGFPVAGENGLLGIAFDPDYAQNRYVYVTYATRTGAGTFGAVARFTDVDNRGEDFTMLLDGVPSAPGHQIESLAFGPDGKLYVSTGDAYEQDAAQDPDALHGKILRMNPDGSRPDDNPFAGSLTYAYGFRNCFDLAFDAAGTLYTVDNGPETLDELNRVEARANYGWPLRLGLRGGDGQGVFADPLHAWAQIVSPAGMLFYQGTQFPAAYRGKLFLVLFGGTYSEGPGDRAKRIQVVDPNASPPTFEDFAVYRFTGLGNPLDVAEGPDGSLYLTDIFQGRIFRIRYEGR